MTKKSTKSPKLPKPPSSLAREICLVLIIKIILISLIWAYFVKDYSVKFDGQQVADHLITKPQDNPPPNSVME
jgi:hypothetical protein